MRTLLKAIVMAPFALLLIAFAIANHDTVSIALDPLNLVDPPLVYAMPLFLPIFIALVIGILLGGIAMWFSERRHRRAAKIYLRDLERQKRDNEELRREKSLPPLPPAPLIG